VLSLPTNKLHSGIQEKNQLLLDAEEDNSDQNAKPPPSKKTKQSVSLLSEEETDLFDALGHTGQSPYAMSPPVEIDEEGSDNDKNFPTASLSASDHEDEEIQDDVDCEAESFMTNGVHFHCILKDFRN
jgi:hypothetical protein